MSKRSLRLVPLLFAPLTFASMVQAHSSEVPFKWLKQQVTVRFNPVRFGKHSLDELRVGQDWRMGMNNASQLETDLPLVGARGVVAPGSYRVNLLRGTAEEFGLQVAGSELATKGRSAYFPAPLAEGKQNDKLELSWLDGKAAKKAAMKAAKKTAKEASKEAGSDEAQPQTGTGTVAGPLDAVDGKHARRAILHLEFGPYWLDMPVTMIGAKSVKVRGYKADAFQWPAVLLADQLQKGQAIPVLGLSAQGGAKSAPRAFNLLITETEAQMLPAMQAPTEQRGFAGVKGFDGNEILRGEIKWADSDKDVGFAAISGITVKGKTLSLNLSCGKRVAAITVPMPAVRR
jgi:hypothetical protein